VTEYSLRDVQRTLGLSRSMILGLVESKYVIPRIGPRKGYRFTFSDLVVLRTAQELLEAKVPARRVSRTLRRLRAQLPQDAPFGGLRIRAAGDRIVVEDGADQWDAGSGQYVLNFSGHPDKGNLSVLPASKPARGSAEEWFAEACVLEEASNSGAADAYRHAIEADPAFADAYVNLGRLLHEQGRLREAEAVYRSGIAHCPSDALLRYNVGVLLDQLGRQQAALQAYRAALALRDDLADCHYNIALLYEAAGHTRAALRHLSAYRRLQAG
jgi:tetratricopeptide (TPR) repeat protein